MTTQEKTKTWTHIEKSDCPHLSELNETLVSEKSACEVCGFGEQLRICLTCAFVACCESHNSHNTEHFQKTGHPFIKPHRCSYDWLWCYKCQAFLD